MLHSLLSSCRPVFRILPLLKSLLLNLPLQQLRAPLPTVRHCTASCRPQFLVLLLTASLRQLPMLRVVKSQCSYCTEFPILSLTMT